MRKDKDKAIELRSYGKSYSEIRKELGVPKSTLSDWLHPHKWSRDIAVDLAEKAKKESVIRLRRLDKIRGEHLKRLYREAEEEAMEEFENLKYHPLFITGIMIYWGEGDRVTKGSIRFANTDPAMVKLFVNFLVHICQIKKDKIKGSILLYPDLDDKICRSYWAGNTGLSENNFYKSVVIQGRHKTNRLRYGVCNIGITSSYLKRKVLLWIELLAKDMLDEGYYKRAGVV